MIAERKQFDIVVFGATGFTGQLVLEYFLTEAETALGHDGALKWAIAGRNAQKIADVKQKLKTKLQAKGGSSSGASAAVDAVPVVIADGLDRDSVLQLVQSTRVVLSVAGPYALYSALMVELCAEHGVHYCDLTGEMTWAKHNADKFETTTQASGARIVHCCGFEAVPSDVMTFLLADRVHKECNAKLSRVNYFWKEQQGGVSGGTGSSLLTMLDVAEPEEVTKMMDPFYFTSSQYAQEKRALVDANTSTKLLPQDPELKTRSALFIGALINQHVVLRSNYLFKDLYGAKFSYIERMGLGNATNWIGSLFMWVVGAMALFDWPRKLLWKLAPTAGDGPSEETMANGYFKAEAHAYTEDGKLAAKGEAFCKGDPGYLITSKMISEVAFCLARNECDGALSGGGILTPAAACGHSLAKRLNDKKLIDYTITKM